MSRGTKRTRSLLAVALLSCLWMLGCQTSGQNFAPDAPVRLPPLNAEVENELRDIIFSGRFDGALFTDMGCCRDDLKDFYLRSGYQPAWIEAGDPTPQALAVLRLFLQADQKALVPEDYDAYDWGNRLAKVRASPSGPEAARLDAALTLAIMRYVHDLHYGRVNCGRTGSKLDLDARIHDLAEFLHEKVVHALDVQSAITIVEPRSAAYWKALDALQAYRQMVAHDDGEQLPAPAKPIKPGQTYPEVVRLARVLRLLGDLPADGTVTPIAYEGALVEAVKRFQARHGQGADGVIDAELVTALNVPLSRRVRQLELMIERWRRLPRSSSQPRILINVPEFKLHAFEAGGREVFERKIIVGGARGRRSPLFERPMKYLVFRPYWDVPRSIQRHEIVPHIEKDRDYIAKHHYQVLDRDGSIVTDDRIDDEVLDALAAGRLRVRQKPGSANALGLVKFVFPNEQNVYLHDTDAPHLFSRDRRDLSHGCIRVEGAAELAAWVLKSNSEWDLERVRATMNGNQNNVVVRLVQPVSVIINYGTAALDQEGRVYFFNDVYGYDVELDRDLASHRHKTAPTVITSAEIKGPYLAPSH